MIKITGCVFKIGYDFEEKFTTVKKHTIDEAKVCVCVCVPLATDSSETINVIVIKRGTVTATDMRMHHMLITLTLTFIQDNTDLILNFRLF